MSKLGDKLRDLKKDIPKISSELDDKVLNAMLTTPKKAKYSFPKWGALAAAMTPVLAMVIILVATNTNSNNPFASNGDVSESSTENAATNSEAAPGENWGDNSFIFTKSTSIAAVGGDSSSDHYTMRDLAYATSQEELRTEINKYHPSYKSLLEQIMGEILAKEDYFVEKSVAIVPFIFSSSEKNITLKEVVNNKQTNEINFLFELFSPEAYDMDILVQFYIVSLKRALFDITLTTNLAISVNNTRNNSATSAYYK